MDKDKLLSCIVKENGRACFRVVSSLYVSRIELRNQGVVICHRRPVVTSVINERSANKWGTPQGYQIQVCAYASFIFRAKIKYQESFRDLHARPLPPIYGKKNSLGPVAGCLCAEAIQCM